MFAASDNSEQTLIKHAGESVNQAKILFKKYTAPVLQQNIWSSLKYGIK